jgi:hypothetical protein
MMDAWMAWFGKIGPAVVGGAPFALGSQTIAAAKPSHATGYSIGDAAALTDGYPHVAYGGGIEVFEIAAMPGM